MLARFYKHRKRIHCSWMRSFGCTLHIAETSFLIWKMFHAWDRSEVPWNHPEWKHSRIKFTTPNRLSSKKTTYLMTVYHNFQQDWTCYWQTTLRFPGSQWTASHQTFKLATDKSSAALVPQNKGDTLTWLKYTVNSGWSKSIKDVSNGIQPSWNFRKQVTIENGLLLKNTRIIIPTLLETELVKRVQGHLGHVEYLLQARSQYIGLTCR